MFLIYDICNTLWISLWGSGITLNYEKFAVQNFFWKMRNMRMRKDRERHHLFSIQALNEVNAFTCTWTVSIMVKTGNKVRFNLLYWNRKTRCDNVHIIFTSCRHFMHTKRFHMKWVSSIGRKRFNFFFAFIRWKKKSTLNPKTVHCIKLWAILSLCFDEIMWKTVKIIIW